MRDLNEIRKELQQKRCLKLYNDREPKQKKKRGRGWIKLQVEAANVRYAQRMNEFKIEPYLDMTIKSIPNATWIQTRSQYMITLKPETEIDDITNTERDMLIDLRTKRLAEIARQIKLHHASNMMILTNEELIIYK